ncbi:hypothetical protein AGABI2DRAFT_53060, partial [Agaricus bisporus var. bisporus H97]|uniref:hypothetical protein n=1 Tax=Agaricus bisporus var. bisporus (strain H97 / ATCC MYA-4626 / FGSC 10389) TaxID=936046 RepID=UPI00029F7912
WLVAQSNVAVKNIAEKLADLEFLDFKLLVSKDFHFDWHEHLYAKIEPNVIRSDDFVDHLPVAVKRLNGSRVILCTLSMLSNDRISTFARVVPPELFIFDEASQIEVGDYIPMLYRYQKTTQKLVFIGDDKQHRMPIPIGNFISQKFYENQLESRHSIRTNTCCRFVDVSHGLEVSSGRSWINEQQAQVVLALARKMEILGLSYHIITPYDAQRSYIETQLKGNKLKWEDKVFNVDSFQGNEDDYIIISLVRTKRVGFLADLRRLNVMLTRCKKGMIICTDRIFVNSVASRSPVAELAKTLGSNVWV